MHYDDVNDLDKSFAVTNDHAYIPTDHFRNRLNNAGAPMKDKKHISSKHYNEINIKKATERAKSIHIDKDDKRLEYFSTTVYLLIEKIIDMLPK